MSIASLKRGPILAGKGDPEIRTFKQQMELEQLDNNTYRSVAGASGANPIKFKGRDRFQAYGGNVYAQAAWAAAQSIEKGFYMHSCYGNWIAPGLVDVPFVFHVQTLKDGKSYCLRRVDVSQIERDGLCFTSTCSFKRPDAGVTGYQEDYDIDERFKTLLKGWKPQDGPRLSFTDVKWIFAPTQRGWTSSLPAARFGVLPMEQYNDNRQPVDRRALYYYSVEGDIPSVDIDPNIHMCNHLFAADRQSTMTVAKHWDVVEDVVGWGSLSMSVVFHTNPEALSMYDSEGNARWFCQEVWTDRLEDGRGTHHSRFWDDKGRHVATSLQDSMLRLKPDAHVAGNRSNGSVSKI